MNRVLLIQTAFIGDSILATALLEELHHRYPGAQLDFLVRKGNESLFEEHPFIHELLIWDKKKAKYRNLWRLLQRIRRQRYDAVINMQRFAATGFLTAFSSGKSRIGFSKNPFSFLFTEKVKHEYNKHEVMRNMDLLGTPQRLPVRPKLYPTKAAYEKVAQYRSGKPYITIAPASVWFTKQFPAEKWVEFLNRIEVDIQVYLIGGPGDHALADKIAHSVSMQHLRISNLCGELHLLETAALMEGAQMNYTNDSGPLHIASAMNAPTRAIFCSTVESFGFGPLSEDSRVIQTEKNLDCRPCGLHGMRECPKGHYDCAMSIHVPMEGLDKL